MLGRESHKIAVSHCYCHCWALCLSVPTSSPLPADTSTQQLDRNQGQVWEKEAGSKGLSQNLRFCSVSTLWPWGWGQEMVLPRATSQGLGPALLPSPRTQKVAYAGRTMGALREKQKGRPKVRPAPFCHLHNHVACVCLSVLHISPNCSPPRESILLSSWLSAPMLQKSTMR